MSNSKKSVLTVDEINKLWDNMKQENKQLAEMSFQCSFTKPKDLKKINILNLLAFSGLTNITGHWIVVIPLSDDEVSPESRDSVAVVYTCFGIVSYDLFDWLRTSYKNIKFILDQQQNLNSSSCGYYCLRFIYQFLFKDSVFNYIIYNNSGSVNDSQFLIEEDDKKFDVEKYKKILNVYLKLISQSSQGSSSSVE